MTLEEFYADRGPFAEAFQPLAGRLTEQAHRLWNSGESFEEQLSPWVARLGKGGLRRDRATDTLAYYPEVSLYRHVMDVSVLASYLLYWAWHSHQLVIDGDLTSYVRALQVIAFCHDADKYVGDARSRSPLLEQVEAIWNDLGGIDWVSPALWPDFSVNSLQAAVSLVENRGQSSALLGPPLPMMVQNLAYMVRQADNFMGKVSGLDALESLDAWVACFNEKLPLWHELYGVPLVSLTWIRLHDEPIVLHQVVSTVGELDLFYPLVSLRRGRNLLMTIPADWPIAEFFEQVALGGFQERKAPRVKRNPTNGSVTLIDCESVADIAYAVREFRVELKDILTIKVADFSSLEKYLSFWMASSSGAMYTLEELPVNTTRKQFAPITWTSGDSDVYDRALMMGLVLGIVEGKGDRLTRVSTSTRPGLEEPMEKVLASMVENVSHLDDISRRTVMALQAALMVGTEEWPDYLTWVHGDFIPSERSSFISGAEIVVDRLRQQCSLACSAENEPVGIPYANPAVGTCLICGRPTGTAMKPSEMELVGVKRSAFNNRMGHQKSLWSQSEPNYLCDACLYTQKLLTEVVQSTGVRSPSKMPLQVVTPVHAIWHVPLGRVQPLSSFDAMTLKENKWHCVLPWNSDQQAVFPLSFEEKPDRDVAERDDVLGQIERLASYAALSGEPVHVFTSAQRELPSAFYYESLPTWLSALLGGLERTGAVDGVSRQNLPRFLQRIKTLREIGHMPGGRETLVDIPTFGWWAVAWVVSREESVERKDRIRLVEHVKEWYRMDDYNELLHRAADAVTEIQRLKLSDSRNKLTRVFRTVLDEYQTMVEQPGVTPAFMESAITGLVFQDLGRSEEYAVNEQKVRKAVAICLAIIAQSDHAGQLTAKMSKYLLAAFEMVVREKLRAHSVQYLQKEPTHASAE